jgi:hypothetical protein
VRHPEKSTSIRLDLVWSTVMVNDKSCATAPADKAADDLLWGAEAIAKEAGVTVPKFRSLFASGALDSCGA